MYFFLKDAFALDDDKHYDLLQRVGQEKKPQTCVEVFVERAENLIAKDPNGNYYDLQWRSARKKKQDCRLDLSGHPLCVLRRIFQNEN